MRFRKRGTSTSGGNKTYTPGNRAVPAKPARLSGGKVLPPQPAIAAVPSTTTTTPTETTTTDVSVQSPKVPHGNKTGIAIFALGTLLIVASNYTKGNVNLWSLLFDPNSKATKTELTDITSQFAFVITLALLGSMSDVIGGIGLLFIIAFWIVWAVKNPNIVQKSVNGTLKASQKGKTSTL